VRKPDILCIGAQKAGTTWFHTNFGGRDDVWVPPFKELHFFDYKYAPDSANWAEQHIRKSVKEAIRKHVSETPDIDLDLIAYLLRAQGRHMFSRKWYGEMFAPADPSIKALDVTPEYSCISEEGVGFVQRFLPATQFIYILRDPVARAISQIKMNLKRKGKLPETRAEWLAAARLPVVAVRGDYQTYVPRWRAAFGPERLKFLPFGLIAQDPTAFMRQVEGFLGMPAAQYPKAGRRVHPGLDQPIPAFVTEFLQDHTRAQAEFLRADFDAEFNALL